MNVQISIRHMIASQVNRQMIQQLCEEINNKFETISSIDVKIEDINGPHKAGIDKRCHLKVRGNNHLSIDIEDTNADINYAIDNAFSRLKQTLERDSRHKHRRLDNTDANAIYNIQS